VGQVARPNFQHIFPIQINLPQNLVSCIVDDLAQPILLGVLIEVHVKSLPFLPIRILILYNLSKSPPIAKERVGKNGGQTMP
jgi:hypothetical protein